MNILIEASMTQGVNVCDVLYKFSPEQVTLVLLFIAHLDLARIISTTIIYIHHSFLTHLLQLCESQLMFYNKRFIQRNWGLC